MRKWCFNSTILYCLLLSILFSCKKEQPEPASAEASRLYFSFGTIQTDTALKNPERGFHLEANYFAHNLQNPWHGFHFPQGWIGDQQDWFTSPGDHLSQLQLYVYLTAYVGRSIGPEAFVNMQRIFDEAKANGFKLILRFAYDHTPRATKVTFKDIFRHLQQLKPFIQKNKGLIDVWQTGFVGAWGEGHSTALQYDWQSNSLMVQQMMEIFKDRYISIRYPSSLKVLQVKESDKKRLGFNNDYFTASEHPLAPKNDYVFGSDDYRTVSKLSPATKVVGEMPYEEDTQWGLKALISVNNTLKIFRDHHYSSFDITQNNALNIQNWKMYSLSPAMLSAQHILFEEEYFKNESREAIQRSAYDFIRDHLGYRLYVDMDKIKLTTAGQQIQFDIPIRNVGFSAVINPRPVYLVLIDEADRIVYRKKLETNPANWQPYDAEKKDYKALVHSIKGNGVVPGLKGNFKVGLWLPDPTPLLQHHADYAIQFANKSLEIWKDDAKKYRVNVVGVVLF